MVRTLASHAGIRGSNPLGGAKPNIRAHLAPFLRVSGSVTYVYVCARRPRTRKNTICNPSVRFGLLKKTRIMRVFLFVFMYDIWGFERAE